MSLTSMISYARIPVAVMSSVTALGSGLLYWKQNELIYPRNIPPGSRTMVPQPSDFPEPNYADSTEHMFIKTPDGEKLSAYLTRPSRKVIEARKHNNLTILMFHGNAGNIGHRLPIAQRLENFLNCNILMLEYRGYGRSTGTPDEKGLNIDAQAGLDYIRQAPELRDSKIVIFGESIGGAVAIELVKRNLHSGDIKSLILENTFLSIRKLIPTILPIARYLTPLCHQIWDSESALPEIKGLPILFLSGLQDEIVPSSHMKRLHEICTAKTKILETFKDGDHNATVACPGFFDTIELFLENYVI